jgi:hypothetical protein
MDSEPIKNLPIQKTTREFFNEIAVGTRSHIDLLNGITQALLVLEQKVAKLENEASNKRPRTE